MCSNTGKVERLEQDGQRFSEHRNMRYWLVLRMGLQLHSIGCIQLKVFFVCNRHCTSRFAMASCNRWVKSIEIAMFQAMAKSTASSTFGARLWCDNSWRILRLSFYSDWRQASGKVLNNIQTPSFCRHIEALTKTANAAPRCIQQGHVHIWSASVAPNRGRIGFSRFRL